MKNFATLDSLLVGYHERHFRMNYTLCIIYINYESVVLIIEKIVVISL